MKILVALKRVADPDNANKVRIAEGGSAIDTGNLEWKPNPFDEYALEAALRLTEDGKSPKQREGDALDGRIVAMALERLVAEEKPDLVLMGKQAVDGDSNQVGQILAERLDWPMATFAATINEEDKGLLVSREVDGGVCSVRLQLPALVTVDLRIVAPASVYSLKTDRAHRYGDGVRFAPLPAIMKAKRKPLDVKPLEELVGPSKLVSHYTRFAPPAQRQAGSRVADVTELVDRLATQAKVI